MVAQKLLRVGITILFLAPPTAGGVLTFVQVYKFSFAGVERKIEEENKVPGEIRSLAVTGDSRHIYATGRMGNSLVILSRDGSADSLAVAGMMQNGVGGVWGLDGASDIAVSPDGKNLYITASGDGLTVFSRDASTGALSYLGMERNRASGVTGLDGLSSVAISPTGRTVYAAAVESDSLVVFSRDTTWGGLTFRSTYRDGQDGLDGLDGATSVAVSADGAQVYVAGNMDHALVVFNHDASGDALTLVEVHTDDANGVDGLRGASAVVASPDGGHVYVVSREDNAVAVFARNPATNRLRFVQAHRDGVEEVDGLAGASSVALSLDGKLVFVAGTLDNAVAVFRRDPGKGTLEFLGALRETADGVEGLAGVTALAVSPDGKHLYTAGEDHAAVSLFLIKGDEPPIKGEETLPTPQKQ